MADHIFGFGDKVVSDTTGTLYDSGGPYAPYNAYEFDYFVIRRSDYGSNTHIFLEVEEWLVADYDPSQDRATDYDYIDVYASTDGYDPTNWTWVERLGGPDISSDVGSSLNTAEGDLPAKFYVETSFLKFVFRSSYRQDYTYSGFKISWFTGGSGDIGGYTDLTGIASNTYDDEKNLKENAMDSQSIVDSNVASDPAKTNWDFIPEGQFDDGPGITTLNYKFTDMNYDKEAGFRVPLSYTSPERIRQSPSVGDISIED